MGYNITPPTHLFFAVRVKFTAGVGFTFGRNVCSGSSNKFVVHKIDFNKT